MDPQLEVPIEPKWAADREKLATALAVLTSQDAGLRVSLDGDSGKTILKGLSEQHLDQMFDRLRREFAVQVLFGSPQVAYREKLTRAVEIDHTHKKLIGAGGEFARVKIMFAPQQAGAGYVFENDVTSGAVPKDVIPYVERGLDRARKNGVLAGFPLIDFRATLVDGAYHEVDSTGPIFEIAAGAALRQLNERKAVAVVEPIMKLEVTTPDEFLGNIIGDINSRRGLIDSTSSSADTTMVTAQVPLAALFGYTNASRGMTMGRATQTLAFSHYASIPHGPDEDDDPPRFPPAIGMRA